MDKLFGTDGVRGRTGEGPLSPENIFRFARAVGYLLKKAPQRFHTIPPETFPGVRELPGGRIARSRVLIGRDTRASGPIIEAQLLDGFKSMGIAVATTGVLTTPGIVHLVRAAGAALGIVISASHNPADDNGLKLISPQGFKIPDEAERAIEDFYFDKMLSAPLQKSDTIRILPPKDIADQIPLYLDALAGTGKPLQGLRLVVDAAEGAASAFAPKLFERMGATVVAIHVSPDGKNINADCGALHPAEMARTVVREKAHAGVAFDGDADRAIFADEKGEIRDGDHVLAICAAELKSRGKLPGDLVVSTVMANFGLESWLKARGIALVRTPVGDRHVAEEMMNRGAVLGGEQSGHVIFFDAATAGDGLLTAVRIFRLLPGTSFSKLCAGFKKAPQVLVNLKVAKKPPLDKVAGDVLQKAEKALEGKGRVVVRYSGTENLCRVMVEGEDAAEVKRVSESLTGELRKRLS